MTALLKEQSGSKRAGLCAGNGSGLWCKEEFDRRKHLLLLQVKRCMGVKKRAREQSNRVFDRIHAIYLENRIVVYRFYNAGEYGGEHMDVFEIWYEPSAEYKELMVKWLKLCSLCDRYTAVLNKALNALAVFVPKEDVNYFTDISKLEADDYERKILNANKTRCKRDKNRAFIPAPSKPTFHFC